MIISTVAEGSWTSPYRYYNTVVVVAVAVVAVVAAAAAAVEIVWRKMSLTTALS